MNSIHEAIKDAFKGGYTGNGHATLRENGEVYWSGDSIFLDRTFWQALGKARGWGKKTLSNGMVANVGRDGYINVWQSYWHDFIDHLAEGKDAESFFTELLR